jgi:hypothetical protein
LQPNPVYGADMPFAVGQLHNRVRVPIWAKIAFMVDSHRAIDYRLAGLTARRKCAATAVRHIRYWESFYVLDRPAD